MSSFLSVIFDDKPKEEGAPGIGVCLHKRDCFPELVLHFLCESVSVKTTSPQERPIRPCSTCVSINLNSFLCNLSH